MNVNDGINPYNVIVNDGIASFLDMDTNSIGRILYLEWKSEYW